MVQDKIIKEKRYEELDALRGIAALIVVLFHFTMNRPEANLGFKLGVTGVDLFFMISGFVIFMSLTKVKNSLDFIINRVSRLYPTYWASVTFTFLLNTIIILSSNLDFNQINFINFLGNLTMFQFYLRIPNIDGPYWTMIIEMIFYLGILFIYHFKILKYLNLIGISLTFFTVIFLKYFGNLYLTKTLIFWIPFLQFTPLFLAGTIYYKLYVSNKNRVQNYFLLIGCLTCQISMYKYSGKSFTFINLYEYAFMLITYFCIFFLFINGKLKFIANRITLFFGKISFALYLIHQQVSIGYLIPILTGNYHVNFWIAALLITFPIIIMISALITFFIEVPFSKKMKSNLKLLFSS